MRCCGTEKSESSAAVKNADSNKARKSARIRKITMISCSRALLISCVQYFGLCPFPADLNQLFDHAIACATVRFRLEVRHDAMAKDGRRDCPDVVEVGNAAGIHGRASLRSQDQVLRCAWSSSPANVALNQIRRIRIVRTRSTSQSDGVRNQRRRCWDSPNQFLQ